MSPRPFRRALRAAVTVLIVLTGAGVGSVAKAESDLRDIAAVVSAYRQQHEREILEEYFDLLRLPNHAADLPEIQRNAEFIVEMLEKRGIEGRVLSTGVGAPAVFGRVDTPGAETTILFYAHYDGQPVVPENWDSNPFEPVLRTDYLKRGGKEIPFESVSYPVDPNLRIFARSTSDDKAPVIGLLTAYDALRANDIPLSVNLKFFFEGEEESGSPHLEEMLAEHGDLLKADVMIFCDGPVHQSGRKKVSFGVRGPVGFEVTVFGPDRPLHSGHYGNFAPNPIVMLAHLITSMRDEQSRILIEGAYDSVIPPTEAELAIAEDLSDADDEIRHELAMGRQESPNMNYHESILWPALNVKGIRAGEVGEKARNAIVTTATASFGYRMVPDQTPDLMKKLTEDHIRDQGYFIVRSDPSPETRRAHPKVAKVTWTDYGYGPVRTPIDSTSAQVQIAILHDLGYDDLVLIPSSGGSLPIWYFKEKLDIPILMLPIANYDNNQHAENENIRIGNLWEGIEIYGVMMAKFGERMSRAISTY